MEQKEVRTANYTNLFVESGIISQWKRCFTTGGYFIQEIQNCDIPVKVVSLRC